MNIGIPLPKFVILAPDDFLTAHNSTPPRLRNESTLQQYMHFEVEPGFLVLQGEAVAGADALARVQTKVSEVQDAQVQELLRERSLLLPSALRGSERIKLIWAAFGRAWRGTERPHVLVGSAQTLRGLVGAELDTLFDDCAGFALCALPSELKICLLSLLVCRAFPANEVMVRNSKNRDPERNALVIFDSEAEPNREVAACTTVAGTKGEQA